MINHLFQSLDSTLARFPNSGIILMGDFNKFNPGPLISSFDLKEIVKSRGTNILDKICTSISTTTMMSKFFHRLDNQIIEVYIFAIFKTKSCTSTAYLLYQKTFQIF